MYKESVSYIAILAPAVAAAVAVVVIIVALTLALSGCAATGPSSSATDWRTIHQPAPTTPGGETVTAISCLS